MVQPLDFEQIFVHFFAGSKEIFFFVALVFFAFLGAKFRMLNEVFLIMMVVFVVFAAGSGYFTVLYSIVILLVGFFFYTVFSRIGKGET